MAHPVEHAYILPESSRSRQLRANAPDMHYLPDSEFRKAHMTRLGGSTGFGMGDIRLFEGGALEYDINVRCIEAAHETKVGLAKMVSAVLASGSEK